MFSFFIVFLFMVELAGIFGFKQSPYYDVIQIFFLGLLFGYILWYYKRLQHHLQDDEKTPPL